MTIQAFYTRYNSCQKCEGSSGKMKLQYCTDQRHDEREHLHVTCGECAYVKLCATRSHV